jgi:hypothetical protein
MPSTVRRSQASTQGRVSAKIISFKQKQAQIRQMRARRPHTPVSFELMRQRELAWMLYITEGHIANMQHALDINCVTFDARDKVKLGKIMGSLGQFSEEIRDLMQRI